MADVLVSKVLEDLTSLILKEAEQEVRLVVGVRKEVEKLTRNLKAIQAVLHDAENRQFKEATVNDWLEKLKDVSFDMDDVLDEWNTEILKSEIEKAEEKAGNVPVLKKMKKKVCFFISSPCFCFRQVGLRHDIAVKIKALNESLDVIAIQKNRFRFNNETPSIEKLERPETTSFLDLFEVRGREVEKETLIKSLCESSQEESGPQIISIVGLGGMGKTTLAQLAYNSPVVESHFEKRMWVCVSDPFDEIKIAKTIVESLTGSRSDLDALDALFQCIRGHIKGKKFLLVLDDVWTEDDTKWSQLKLPFQFGSSGSRILVTTRKEISANVMKSADPIRLRRLPPEDSWSLFSQIAFYNRSSEERKDLEQLGRDIVDKCKGLPLALKILGGHLRLKKREEQWRNVLDSRLWHSEEIKKGLFAPLSLSFYDLPSTLKRCFSYCAIYPKDTKIYIDNLIELWMAQGYFNSKGSIEIEMIGQQCFEDLAMRSFFQDFKKSEDDGRIIYCQMHDIVHDFAQSLTENECFAMNVDDNKELGTESFYKARHLTLTSSTKQTLEVPSFVYKAKHLRALVLLHNINCKLTTLPPDLFLHLTSLRTLDLSSQSITEVPEDVDRLIHLRYLNLSDNYELKELPESICNLCNLQTLDVSCESLTKLPQGMGKLINLRHLTLFSYFKSNTIKSFPKGFGRLSSLRKLNLFVVSDNDDSEGCKLGELKDLNHLRGHLQIEGLGNLIEVCEVEHAQLKKKIHLNRLNLAFNREGEENKRMENDEVLLNALEPHPNLECLYITYYHGTAIFPNWLMPIKLKELILEDCNKLECLHSLGRLPFLESLKLYELKSVKKVGVEFFGIETKDGTLPSSSSSLIFFPKLKSLKFQGLERWEEWDGIGGMREGEKDFGVTIMPLLHILQIVDCPNLKTIPHFFLQKTPLKKLIFLSCPILKQRCEKETGEDWPKISHIPNIWIN